MRFERRVRIVRGQLDVAPFAGLFFLLVLFLLLNSTLVFVPGLPVRSVDLAGGAPDPRRRVVRVERNHRVRFDNRSLGLEEFLQQLPTLARTSAVPWALVIETSDAAEREPALRLRQAARDLNVPVLAPGAQIELPPARDLPGFMGPALVAAVTLGGQVYLENRAVDDEELVRRLQEAVRQSAEPLTLVILADRAVETEVWMRLVGLGRQAGVTNFWQATGLQAVPVGKTSGATR
jgi:biopolymer transport protein ExbD